LILAFAVIHNTGRKQTAHVQGWITALKLGLLGCLVVLILVILLAGGWFIGVRNHLVDLDQQVQSQ